MAIDYSLAHGQSRIRTRSLAIYRSIAQDGSIEHKHFMKHLSTPGGNGLLITTFITTFITTAMMMMMMMAMLLLSPSSVNCMPTRHHDRPTSPPPVADSSRVQNQNKISLSDSTSAIASTRAVSVDMPRSQPDISPPRHISSSSSSSVSSSSPSSTKSLNVLYEKLVRHYHSSKDDGSPLLPSSVDSQPLLQAAASGFSSTSSTSSLPSSPKPSYSKPSLTTEEEMKQLQEIVAETPKGIQNRWYLLRCAKTLSSWASWCAAKIKELDQGSDEDVYFDEDCGGGGLERLPSAKSSSSSSSSSAGSLKQNAAFEKSWYDQNDNINQYSLKEYSKNPGGSHETDSHSSGGARSFDKYLDGPFRSFSDDSGTETDDDRRGRSRGRSRGRGHDEGALELPESVRGVVMDEIRKAVKADFVKSSARFRLSSSLLSSSSSSLSSSSSSLSSLVSSLSPPVMSNGRLSEKAPTRPVSILKVKASADGDGSRNGDNVGVIVSGAAGGGSGSSGGRTGRGKSVSFSDEPPQVLHYQVPPKSKKEAARTRGKMRLVSLHGL